MKKILVVLLTLVVCFSAIACGAESEDVRKVESGELSFEIPADWIDDSDEEGLAYSNSAATCGVLVSRHDLSDLPQKEIQSIATEFADHVIESNKKEISDVKKEKIKIDKTVAIRIDYNMNNSDGSNTKMIKIIAISQDNYLNNITFVLENENEQSGSIETLEKIIKSIQL